MVRWKIATLALLLATSSVAHADVGVEHTRLVYRAEDRSVSLRVWNRGKTPSLIQAWIDDGNIDAAPEALRVPFIATPPMFRLEPGRNRDIGVRALNTGQLPTDRESLYWLNVLDVPALKQVAAKELQPEYAVHWRLKIFHRPAGLEGSAAAAAAGLGWRIEQDKGWYLLRAVNNSGFHVTLVALEIHGKRLSVPLDDAIVAPRSTWALPLSSSDAGVAGALRVTWVNDEGGHQVTTARLGQ